MASKHRRVIGGYRFARFTGQPQPELVETGIPPAVTIGLAPAGTTHMRPLVEEGESVSAGQIIARDDETTGSPVLALPRLHHGGQAGALRSDPEEKPQAAEVRRR